MSTSFASRLVVLILIVLTSQATCRVRGDEAAANGATLTEWQQLLARQKELHSMEPPSLEAPEFNKFLNEYSRRAGELADGFKQYYEKHPAGKEGNDAWRHWMNNLEAAAHGSPERKAEFDQTIDQLLADPKLSTARRQSIRWTQVDRIRDLAERERFVRSVKDDFNNLSFISYQLLNIAEFSDAEHARKLVDEVLELIGSQADYSHFQKEALALREKLNRIGKRIDLKFAALDGKQIDLKNYSGKVVLIDFWATWCRPCLAGLPEVRAVFEKYHGDGFEILGITYDEEREKLEAFLKKTPLPWPQFFSPDGKSAPLSAALGSPGPPAYWLVDQNGILVDLNANMDLENKVRRLLAKKPN